MKPKILSSKYRDLFYFALLIAILLLFAGYEAERKQGAEVPSPLLTKMPAPHTKLPK